MSSGQLRGQPQSVADPDREAYEEMIRRHKLATAATREEGAQLQACVKSPGEVDAPASFADEAFGFARRGRRAWEEGRPLEAIVDAGKGVADMIMIQDGVGGLLKGGVKTTGPFKWGSKPWEEAGYRKWMGQHGFLEPGQHGHHWAIPNNQWGKSVPDWFKNQPWNIKGMESAVVHGRVHGRYKGAPQFNVLERYWHGTPRWWKAANAALAGEGAEGVIDAKDQRR